MRMRDYLGRLARRGLRLTVLAALLLAGAPVPPARADGTPLKLSGAFSRVWTFQLSPNGLYAVFLADPDGDSNHTLYSVTVSGGSAPVTLAGPFVFGSTAFAIAPDSSRVVYQGTPTASPGSAPDLFSQPIAGGAAAPLNGSLDLPLFNQIEISADNQYVVFLALSVSGDYQLLYRNALLGGQLASISPDGSLPQQPLRHVVDYKLTPDGASAYFRAYDPDDDNTPYMLLRSTLSAEFVAWKYLVTDFVDDSLGIHDYQIGSDSETVIFTADLETEGVVELYHFYEFDLPPYAIWKINGTLVHGTSVEAFAIAPDSSRVAYLAAQAADANPADENAYELFGAVEVFNLGNPYINYQLNGSLVDQGSVLDFRFSADSSRVVYRADQDSDGTYELYSVSSLNDNSVEVKLNTTAGSLSVRDYELTPDSSQVVYAAGGDLSTQGLSLLYRVPLLGGGSTQLDEPVAFAYNPDIPCSLPLSITPNSQRAIYIGSAGGDSGLHSALLAGGAPDHLSGGVNINGCYAEGNPTPGLLFSPPTYRLHPDSQRVVFIGSDPAALGLGFQLWVTEGADLPYQLFLPVALR